MSWQSPTRWRSDRTMIRIPVSFGARDEWRVTLSYTLESDMAILAFPPRDLNSGRDRNRTRIRTRTCDCNHPTSSCRNYETYLFTRRVVNQSAEWNKRSLESNRIIMTTLKDDSELPWMEWPMTVPHKEGGKTEQNTGGGENFQWMSDGLGIIIEPLRRRSRRNAGRGTSQAEHNIV